jgi:hypothetical protein
MQGVTAMAVALGLATGSVPLAAAQAPVAAPAPSASGSASASPSPSRSPGRSPSASPSRSGVFVQVTPDTVQADFLIGIDASCGDDNRRSANVESAAFGKVTVRPQNGILTAAATVPADRRPDTYRVHLTCPNGRTATTTLRVLSTTRPSRGPATGFGGTAGGDDRAWILITAGLLAIVAGTGLGVVTLRRRRV